MSPTRNTKARVNDHVTPNEQEQAGMIRVTLLAAAAAVTAMTHGACGAEAEDASCTGPACAYLNPFVITGNVPRPFGAGAGDAAAGNVSTPPDDGGESRRTVSGLARGNTSGGGGPERSAGFSGSLSEQVVMATDAGFDPNAGRSCETCDAGCDEAIELCDEQWHHCSCADLCYYGCLQDLGGCGYEPEELEWRIERAEWQIEELDIVCP